jgi:hypothetical protein
MAGQLLNAAQDCKSLTILVILNHFVPIAI